MWSELGPDLRAIYQKWDNGGLTTEHTIAAISRLGVCVPQEFVNVLCQYSRSRNLPFTTFMKSLQHGVFPASTEFENRSVLPNSPRDVKQLSDFNLKSYKSAPCEKAPYGTSLASPNDDAHLETTSVCSSVRCGTLKPSQKKALPHTAQMESNECEDDCGSSQCGGLEVPYLPPHLQRNINVFASDGPNEEYFDIPQSKICAGHGDIIGWTQQTDESGSATSRKHFERPGNTNPLKWTEPEPVTVTSRPMSSNLLAHPENERRRGTATTIQYPFATEADDLATARDRIRKQRLDKQKA